ncbi:MAG: hypothetical protein Q8K70_10885 [Bacteroidota bacterium]|nr:hypothetical protein [Bacteroidota bacterium]
MKNKILFLSLLFLLSSCGVITKARYGNGLKLNLETRLFSKNKNEDQSKKTILKNKIKPTQTNEKKDSVIFVGEEFNIDEPETNTLQNFSESPILNRPLLENKPNKTSLKSKIRDLKDEISVKKLLNPIVKKQVKNDGYRPFEPNAIWAGVLFYGSYFLLLIPPLSFIASISSLIGIILAFVSLRKIKLSGGLYRGYGLAISIIILFIISLLYLLILLGLIFAFLI